MSNFHLKTAQYSIATVAALILVIAAPAFAERKGSHEIERFFAQPTVSTTDQNSSTSSSSSTVTAADSASSGSNTTDESSGTTTAATASSSSDSSNTSTDTGNNASTPPPPTPVQPAPEPVAPATPVAPSPITSTLNAIGAAVSSAKAKLFPKSSSDASTATTTRGVIATTGIASLFQGSAAADVYDSNKFNQSDTYKLLALALALAAAGIFLTNTKVFSRTYRDLAGVIAVGQRKPQPGHVSRFRA